MPIGSIFKSAVVFSAFGAAGEMIVTSHYKVVSEPIAPEPISEAHALATKVQNGIISYYAPLMGSNVFYERTEVIGITEPTAQAEVNVRTVGTVAQENVSYRSTVLLRNVTGLRGRSYSGYQSYIAPTEGQQGNGILLPSFVTSMQTFADAMLSVGTVLVGTVFDQVVYSRLLLTDTPVVSTTVRAKCGSNKRRQSTTG